MPKSSKKPTPDIEVREPKTWLGYTLEWIPDRQHWELTTVEGYQLDIVLSVQMDRGEESWFAWVQFGDNMWMATHMKSEQEARDLVEKDLQLHRDLFDKLLPNAKLL
jgi:hypothetical protein